MTDVLRKKVGLSADSSDDEMPTGNSHLNADSSDEEGAGKKMNADSSDDDGPPHRTTSTKKITADSSDDEGPVDKLPASKSSKVAPDSSEDEGPLDRNTAVANKADSSDDDEPVINAKKKLQLKKPQASLDSSDDEGIGSVNTSIKISKPIIDSDESDADKPLASNNADSSDEESAVTTTTATKSKKRKIKRTVDSDSDSDGPPSQNSTSTPSQKSQNSQFNPSKKSPSNLLKNKDLYDAESSEDELPEIPYTPNGGKRSGSDNSEGEDMESLDAIKNKVVQKHKKSPKTERSSAKNAMMEIRSESARITRESAIGLPYHKPKQRTLEEFLNRKKGTPDFLKSMHLKKFDARADKMLEEREKKMIEFYKSESEEEEEVDEDKDYDPNADTNATDAALHEEKGVSVIGAGSEKKSETDALLKTGEKDSESKIQDSGILSGLGTSDESNQNTDEDKSSPNSPTKVIENPEAKANNDSVMDTEENQEESLKLILEPDTPNLECDDDEIIFNSQVPKDDKSTPTNKAWSKLEALKSRFGDLSSLEKTLQMTPTISEGADDDLIICETEKPSLSTGAQKLFSRFFNHAKACKGQNTSKKEEMSVENLTIVSKKIVDGKEILSEDVVEYKFDEPKEEKKALNPGTAYLTLKEKLKKEMMAKRSAERMKRAAIMKMNNEEGGYDELPDDEEMGLDDEELEDEEYDEDEEGEDEEGESEPEENDVDMKDNKRVKNGFVDDEAEDDEELSENEDDNDSVAFEDMPKKSQFRKIVDPELLSESSNTSDIFNKLDRIRSDAETPTEALNQSKLNLTSAPSSNSSFGALISAEPRWTPFQDRIRSGTVELTSAENTLQESPTNSQLAKKQLGFEGLFDQTDPDVSDIDDVIGLCSGKFVTQDGGMSQAASMASGKFFTQPKLPHDISGLTPLESSKLDSLESQDTVILTNNSRPNSRSSHTIETQDTVILTGNVELNVSNAISSLDKMLGLDDEESEVGHGAIESDDENEEGGIKISKKRKRRVVSDSDDSDDESDNKKEVGGKDSVKDLDDDQMEAQVEYDSDENEIKKPKFKQNLFDKKGKLKKDFFEAEAELSGGSEEEFSDDEDERGLDRLEMEEGDLDDIDEAEESEKVGRIHQKVLLDEDQAALKLFQERFLEDGDLHTDIKRQKQFKWSGLDDNIEVGPRKDDEAGEQEEETLEKWRLAKMEREKWIQDQEKKQGNTQDEEDSQFFQLADRTLQRMSSKDETVNSSELLEKEKIFKSPPAKFGPLQPLQNLGGGLRGSFLARGEASLDKIAQFNKVKDDRVGAGAKGRNFVFAAVSPPKQAGDGGDDSPVGKKGKVKPPPAKKVKRCRTLDENSKGTIFNLL